MTDEVKAAQMVTGEELELMLTEWDLPLVVDAYATWYVMDVIWELLTALFLVDSSHSVRLSF
jgi:hypothetical protein